MRCGISLLLALGWRTPSECFGAVRDSFGALAINLVVERHRATLERRAGPQAYALRLS